ncbi:hypothetical protein [Rhizobium lentis]|uniref:hypothetical protein n=1 Tax=Rhizobium lentis TaxID=1138194 RepID=UPI002180A1C5|nr:hypothetical protein [Rhizobium lentis]
MKSPWARAGDDLATAGQMLLPILVGRQSSGGLTLLLIIPLLEIRILPLELAKHRLAAPKSERPRID